MRKHLIIVLLALFGAFASEVSAQTSASRNGNLVLAGNGTDLTNTLTLKSTSLLAPKTYTFPSPLQGLFHSTPGGVLSISLLDLNSIDVPSDVTGILQPVNGGSGVANTSTINWGANNITFTTTGATNLTLPTSGTVVTSTGALTPKGVVSTDASGILVATALTNGQLHIGSTGNVPVAATLTGTANRLAVTNGLGSITLNIDPNYVGQSTITTVSTLTSGATGSGFTVALGSSTITGVLTEANGGTHQSSYTTGDLLYASATNTLSKLPFVGTATRYLANTGTGGTLPAWDFINLANGVTGVLLPTNGGTGVSNNNANIITLGGTLTTTTGNITLNAAGGGSNVTLPVSGVLATTTGGTFILNQATQQASSNFNITGQGQATSFTGTDQAAGAALSVRGGNGSGTTGGNVTVAGGSGTSGAGGSVTIAAGTGAGTSVGSGITATTAAATTTGNGGDFSLTTGNGAGASGRGGNVTITSGNGGTTTANGGNFSVTAGNTGSTSGTAGAVSLTAGNANFATGVGGSATILGGTGNTTGIGGTTTLQGGTGGATGGGGVSLVQGGAGGATSGDGGAATVTGGVSTSGTGGFATLSGGNSLSGKGGGVEIYTGSSGGTAGGSSIGIFANNASTSGVGGGIFASSGSGAGTTQSGGTISFTAGNGGAITSTGGPIIIKAGNGGSTSGAGGTASLSAGNAATSGAGGAASVIAGNGVGTDQSGGGVTISGGNASGLGSSSILFQTAKAAGATGSGTNTALTNMTLNGAGNLTLNAAGGSFIFTASSGGGTTTFTPGNQSGNSFTYTLPIVAPTANQVLTSVAGGASSALSWTNGLSTTNGVQYNLVGPQNTASLVGSTNYLFNVAYAVSATADAALGAQIASTAGTSGANNATGLTINTTANTTGVANGLVLNTTATGAGTLIDITSPAGNPGKALTIQPGSGAAATNAGGAITIQGGTGNTTGAGGAVTIAGGTSPSGTGGVIDLFTSNLPRMRVNAGGFLSIGNNNFAATSPIHVISSNPGSSAVLLQNTSSTGYTSVDFKNDVGTVGNVGISNSGAGAFTGQFYFNISSGTILPMTFNQGNTEKMAIDANGNIDIAHSLGIGFTSGAPNSTRTLNVSGTAGTVNTRISSLGSATPATTGGVIYADANGDVNRLAAPATSGQVLSSTTGGTLSWASAPMLASGGVTPLSVVSGTTEYCSPMGQQALTQNADVVGKSRILIPKPGTVKNLFVALSADPGNTNTRVFTLTKNGVATAVTCTVTGNGATSKTANDQAHSFTVVAGDEISLKILSTQVGGALAASDADWGFEIDTP